MPSLNYLKEDCDHLLACLRSRLVETGRETYEVVLLSPTKCVCLPESMGSPQDGAGLDFSDCSQTSERLAVDEEKEAVTEIL